MNNNLNLFSTLFLVKGIITCFFCFFPLIYVFLGLMIPFEEQPNQAELPFDPGLIFVFIGSIFFFIVLALAIATLITAKKLKQRKGYNFIFVMAIINCLTGVLGIILGVFTLMELQKPEIKSLFFETEES